MGDVIGENSEGKREGREGGKQRNEGRRVGKGTLDLWEKDEKASRKSLMDLSSIGLSYSRPSAPHFSISLYTSSHIYIAAKSLAYSSNMAGVESDSGSSTIEQTYQKKTPLEHILLRPDTYVGSLEHQDSKMWVWDAVQGKMALRQVSYVPGLYKIFDEILVNAADNYQRDRTMSKIEVHIDAEEGWVSVWNNGKGIPVAKHAEYGIYVPELIFGHLLTSSNYDDTKKKVTGGRNGYGAKLANVFSTKFVVETADSERMLKFRMEWRSNMQEKTTPQITKMTKKEDYTCVTFYPDLRRLQMHSLDRDIVEIMTKRVYDLAGCTCQRVKVWLNGSALQVKSFQDYIGLYPVEDVVFGKVGDRWEVAFALSDGIFQQVSFVNCICTTKGGTHVGYIADQLTDSISGALQKKHKKSDVKPAHIKAHMWLFVNCLIENPAFDSQTKETLTLKSSQFGSACELDDNFVKDVLKSGILEAIVAFADAKTQAQLSKKVKGKKSDKVVIPKLEDANDAGSKHSEDCTLMLTEGDSAKTLAVSGFEIVGRDRFGVFPLKGKLLNVREASAKQLMENEEIQNIMKIMGLKPKRDYADLKELRYGSLMVMADQDLDGSHIKGLLINFIHFFWPGLLKRTGFLKEFITPIVKATRGSETKAFYTIQQFEDWAKTVEIARWRVKYYKGLGTSTAKEAKEYFSDLNRHKLRFIWKNDAEDADAIDLAFNKKRADDRKQWLAGMEPDVYLDMQGDIQYANFINKELILFSQYDNVRSIPSAVDGLKPGQRKILFACFKRKLTQELKVAQLSGYVAEISAYHHGEASLAQTIVGLAQRFVGSNNINLLQPIGQFGSRAQGGKDQASPRYVFTELSPVTRRLFPEFDDPLLTYQSEEGLSIEPHWYVPVIPMVLVNGADGIGTGWSTSVPQYNPLEIIRAYRGRMQDVPFATVDLHPWYKGFIGDIQKSANGYEIRGKFARMGEEFLQITELPLKKWTTDYKAFLLEMTKEDPPFITDLKEYHTDTTVHFEVRCPALSTLSDKDICKKFKLATSMSTGNLVLFNSQRKITKYESVADILEEHYGVRMEFYVRRKAYLISKLTRDCETINNKVRFILMVLSGDIIINMKKRQVLCEELRQKGFTTHPQLEAIFRERQTVKDVSDSSDMEVISETQDKKSSKDYNYLLGMSLWSLTLEEVERLKQEKAKAEEDLETLRARSVFSLWQEDLDVLEENILAEWRREEENDKALPGSKKAAKKTAPAQKRVKKENKPTGFKSTEEGKSAPKQTTLPETFSQPKPEPKIEPKKTVFDLLREKTPALKRDTASEGGSSSSDFSNPLGRSRVRLEPDKGKKLVKEPTVVEVDNSSDSEFEL